jgi:hypothetical protein
LDGPLKGFDGDVSPVGSDDTYSYSRFGHLFRSYYKVPTCAAKLLQTLALEAGAGGWRVLRGAPPHTGGQYNTNYLKLLKLRWIRARRTRPSMTAMTPNNPFVRVIRGSDAATLTLTMRDAANVRNDLKS